MLEFLRSLPFIIFMIMGILVIAFYLIPTWVALYRGKKQKLVIFVINLFTGWTVIGWLGSLIWASVKEESDRG
jgi:hypothetical protein